MEIDNSQASQFRECPLKWYETNVAGGTGLELKPKLGEVTPLDLGSRLHELLEEYYCELAATPRGVYPVSDNPALENEAQMIMEQYKAKYSQENFEIVDVERTFRVALPLYCDTCYSIILPEENGTVVCYKCGSYMGEAPPHIYTGKIDVIFRQDGKLNIMDHKSQKRGSQSNDPKKWAARDQASLYLWATSKIYQEEIGNFYVNILQRPSEKLQKGPVFPDRQKLERTTEQIEIAVRDIVFIADEIERYKAIFGHSLLWPSNREICKQGWGECEFYVPHTYGWSDEIKEQKYQPKQEYLHLGGVAVIQP